MFVGESLGSHSLHSFAESLQRHINSPEASSCLTSRRKPLQVLKPFSLNFMATEKSARNGGRQSRGHTSKDLPPDLYELYKTDPKICHHLQRRGPRTTAEKNATKAKSEALASSEAIQFELHGH